MLAALRKDVKTFPDDGQFQTPTGDLVCLQYLGVVGFPTVSGAALDGRDILWMVGIFLASKDEQDAQKRRLVPFVFSQFCS